MEEVRVETDDLIKILKENRKRHEEEYKETFEGYKEDAIMLLEKSLGRAKSAKTIKDIRTSLDLMQPECHLEDYDSIIGMLELCLDDSIEVTQQEYRQYVQDKWGWKHGFALMNTRYNKTLM